MADNLHPTIQELLQKNIKQAELLLQQQKLIWELAKALDDNGLSYVLDTAFPSTKLPSQRILGPHSRPIEWTGTTSDLVPILIGCRKLSAMIMDDEHVRFWQKAIQLETQKKKSFQQMSAEDGALRIHLDTMKQMLDLDPNANQIVEYSRPHDFATAIWKFGFKLNETVRGFACQEQVLLAMQCRKMEKQFDQLGIQNPFDDDTTWVDELMQKNDAKYNDVNPENYQDMTLRFEEGVEEIKDEDLMADIEERSESSLDTKLTGSSTLAETIS